MANDNSVLIRAGKAKKDEFYTLLSTIEAEVRFYADQFKGKVVLCNCDDPYESNFFKFFAMNFNVLGLKKLMATCYATSPIIYTQLSLFGEAQEVAREYKRGKPYSVTITEIKDYNGDGRIDLADVELMLKSKKNAVTLLDGDGDFRSDECVRFLKQADIICTNPPFSLFREYITQLIQYEKKFLIIGNQNAVTYKEVFPLILHGKVWYGASIHSHGRDFRVPDDYPLEAYEYRTDEQGLKYINVKGVRWFTNIDYKQRHEPLILYRHYTPDDYPKYDNYDVIEVSKTADIPCDYDGVMGVPISFMDKFNPEQFEIIGMAEDNGKGFSGAASKWDGKNPHCIINGGRPKYKRIFIRRKNHEN